MNRLPLEQVATLIAAIDAACRGIDVADVQRSTRMYESQPTGTVPRPAACPFCNSKIIDTLAKVFTVTTFWRCKQCDETWTIASLASRRPQ
jgi:ribosomal protein L37AE/L43A